MSAVSGTGSWPTVCVLDPAPRRCYEPSDFHRLGPMQALSGMFPILLMFGIFYFVLIRPQVKRQRETQAMLSKLGKGDEVITRGGIIGKITGISDDGIVVLELQEKVRVRVPRAYIEGKWEGKVPETAAKSAA
ncbi:MAG TPA: preprotein translocase subunit YajC [Kofleriaceae bacterium]|nr:preprotein translocase subunit YajC [Kofleriaceae bacterium]